MKKLRITTFLVFCLIFLISSGCAKTFRYSIGCAKIAPDREFSFFIVSDIHHLSKGLYDNGKAFDSFLMSGDGKLLKYTEEIFDAFIAEVKASRPDFLIITGDLTCNGELESHLEMVEKLKAVESLGTCVFVIPGNHDLENPWAMKYSGEKEIPVAAISDEDFLKLYEPFGYEGAISKDPASLSYLAMPTGDTWLLMLDSSDHRRNLEQKYPEKGGTLLPETLEWVEQCAELARNNNARLIAVMHHSLIDHSSLVNQDYTVSNDEEVLKVFYKNGIEIILTGHVHIQDIETGESEGKVLYDIATGGLSVYPHQYGKMYFKPGYGFDYSTALLNVSTWAETRRTEDKALHNFVDYSSAVFIEQCCKNYIDCMNNLEKLPADDRDKAFKALSDMNLMYFSGYRNEAMGQITNSEGYRLLERMPDCFTKEYLDSMLHDERADNNIIHIPVKE